MSTSNRDPAAQAGKSIVGAEELSTGRTISAITGSDAFSFDRAIASLAGAESLLEAGNLQADVDWLSALSLVRLTQESLLPMRQSVFGSIADRASAEGGAGPESSFVALAARSATERGLFGKIEGAGFEALNARQETMGTTSEDEERAGARLSDLVVSLAGVRAVITQVNDIVTNEHAGYLLRAGLCTIESVGQEVDNIARELGGAHWGIFDPEDDLSRVGG